jgi:nucleoside-diphosphate-sugar epimerase
MAPFLQEAGHEVVGLDTFLFDPCCCGPEPEAIPALNIDVRDVVPEHLRGFDAVIHLAGLSNDPLGNLSPDCTYDINHRGSIRLALAAKEAGVQRYLFASSCSIYGAAGDEMLDETAQFSPVTPYAESKVLVEAELTELADETFSPIYLRNATAYGFSPRLRADIVLNDMVGAALLTGEIVIKSDGTPWRPLVHIEDISRAFLAALEAPLESVHNQAFNVGASSENYQMRDIADIVQSTVPGSRIVYAAGGGPDLRCYRVDFSKIGQVLPGFEPQWSVARGAAQLYAAYVRLGLSREDWDGGRYVRLQHLSKLLQSGQVDSSLRWQHRAAIAV